MVRSLPLVLLLTACASPTAPPVPVDAAAQDRSSSLDPVGGPLARVRDGALAFAPSAGGWTARVPMRGVSGRVDAAGAELRAGGERFAVRTVEVGRAGAVGATVDGPAVEGACLPGRVDAEGACVRRVERGGDGVIEWWAAGPDGLQQGWELAERPAGAGPLVVTVAVAGATVAVEDDAALLTRGEAALTVDGLAAWDADGRALPIHLDEADEGFAVVVDDAGARYPVVIDPVYATPIWTLDGTGNESFGSLLARAGDVNGDGFEDLLVSAPTCRSFPGCVYVFHGSASGFPSTANLTLTGESAGDDYARAIAGAGDVNADGYDDVLVSAYRHDKGAGRVYLYTGSSRGLPRTATTTLDGTSPSQFFGRSVAGAGDVNGDGVDDVAIGAPTAGLAPGSVYVYHGSPLGLPTLPNTELVGETKGDSYGFAVSTAGDVNGDGFDDLVVGAQDARSSSGRVYVHHGSSAGVDTAWTTALTGEAPNNFFGSAVSDAGDTDGDGFDDIVVGAPGYRTGTGSAYVYRGSSTGVETTATTAIGGENTHDSFGGAVSDAGDVSGDGFADVVVGAYGFNADSGRVYVFEGTAFGTSRTASATLDGEGSGHFFGVSVLGAGDVDADGFDDVLVGAYAVDAENGRIYLFQGYGDEVDLDGDGYPAGEDCDDDNPVANPGATEVCDPKNTDENCNEVADDNDLETSPLSMTAWQLDGDADGYTDPASEITACDPPDGYFAPSALPDCDDDDPSVRPNAQEVCDGRDTDENCDGLADDADPTVDAAGFSTFAADADEDGYTDAESTLSACDAPDGYGEPSDEADCDDADPAAYPGATEVPDDGIDQDCDGADATDGGDNGGGGDDTGGKGDEGGGCGCATTRPGTASWLWLGLALAVGARRRAG